MSAQNLATGHCSRGGDRGASAVEYSLLVSAIAAVVLLVVFAVGAFTKGNFQDTCDAVAGAANSTSVPAVTC